jgi:hypothetical protein
LKNKVYSNPGSLFEGDFFRNKSLYPGGLFEGGGGVIFIFVSLPRGFIREGVYFHFCAFTPGVYLRGGSIREGGLLE